MKNQRLWIIALLSIDFLGEAAAAKPKVAFGDKPGVLPIWHSLLGLGSVEIPHLSVPKHHLHPNVGIRA